MMRRVLKKLLLVILGLAAALSALLAFLTATSPGPRPTEGWTRLADMPDPRGELAMAAVETPAGVLLYVIGGIQGIRSSERVSIYDTAADIWSNGPAIPAARNHAAAAVLNGAIYLSGGYCSATLSNPSTNFWTLAPGSGIWEELDAMPEGRAAHGMVASNGKLYAMGGEGVSANVLVYDPERGWTAGAPIPVQRHHVAVVLFEDEISDVWTSGVI